MTDKEIIENKIKSLEESVDPRIQGAIEDYKILMNLVENMGLSHQVYDKFRDELNKLENRMVGSIQTIYKGPDLRPLIPVVVILSSVGFLALSILSGWPWWVSAIVGTVGFGCSATILETFGY